MKVRRFMSSLMVASCVVALIGFPAGCSAQPTNEHVAAERKIYNAVTPTFMAILDDRLPVADIGVDERADIKTTLAGWDLLIKSDEAPQATSSPPVSTASPPGG